MIQDSVFNKSGPNHLKCYRVSHNWFEIAFSEHQICAEFNSRGDELSGLFRVEVCDGDATIALFDSNDLHHVTVLTTAASEALRLEAKRVGTESTY